MPWDITKSSWGCNHREDWSNPNDSWPEDFTLPPDVVGYINNPRWVSSGTPEHYPCGYWYRNIPSTEILYSCGDNAIGSTGQGYSSSPSSNWQWIFAQLSPWKWLMISCGGAHFVGIRDDGTLWGVGANNKGQLGIASTADAYDLRQISGERWKYVDCGTEHTLLIKGDGSLWGMGANTGSQLGLGVTERTDKTVITLIDSVRHWSKVSGGLEHSLALCSDNTVWGAGENAGRLGTGDFLRKDVFTYSISAGFCTQIAAGSTYSYVLDTNTAVKVSGGNVNGIFANGTTTGSRMTFGNINTSFGTGWTQIETGYGCVYGMRAGGTIWSVGANSYGQLGVGDYVQKNVFTQVNSGVAYIEVKAGMYYQSNMKHVMMARGVDGRLYSCGDNTKGGLSIGRPNPPNFLGSNVLIPTTFGNNSQIFCRLLSIGGLMSYMTRELSYYAPTPPWPMTFNINEGGF